LKSNGKGTWPVSRLIIDGYNVIWNWPGLKEHRHDALGAAREKLIEILLEYQAFSGEKIIVVFDAYQVKGYQPRREEHRGLEVIYTEPGQTADSLIEALVTRLSGPEADMGVVTSDWAQQQIVLGKGARRWSSGEFYLEVQRVLSAIATKAKHTQRGSQTTRFENRLNLNIKENMEEIRRKK